MKITEKVAEMALTTLTALSVCVFAYVRLQGMPNSSVGPVKADVSDYRILLPKAHLLVGTNASRYIILKFIDY
jgi:hypothetical protein